MVEWGGSVGGEGLDVIPIASPMGMGQSLVMREWNLVAT